jgi:hypothetical protein
MMIVMVTPVFRHRVLFNDDSYGNTSLKVESGFEERPTDSTLFDFSSFDPFSPGS